MQRGRTATAVDGSPAIVFDHKRNPSDLHRRRETSVPSPPFLIERLITLDPERVAASRILVFTDLDGTLLDHDTYSFDAAKPALALLEEHGIPVIFNTSKTFVESERLAASMMIASPFVIETGGAIAMPKSREPGALPHPGDNRTREDFEFEILGTRVEEILDTLAEARDRSGFQQAFRGFSEMSVDELAGLTGLDRERAAEAKAREFSEPIRWVGAPEDLVRFETFLAARRLRLVRGGRFHHVIGDTGKRRAMLEVVKRFQQHSRDAILTIALGDSDNDIAMLKAADIAVVVRNDKTPELTLARPNVVHTSAPGPVGWAQAIDMIVDRYTHKKDGNKKD